MAPRRGGGGGSGGGGSSGLSDSPWGEKTQLFGFHFRNPYRTASVVFLGIGMVGIVVIMIWAATIKKHQEPNKKLFRWFSFWLTAIALFVYFAMQFIALIMREVEAVVQIIYFLIVTIILQSGSVADISLLGVLYLLLPHCSSHPNRQSSRPSVFKGVQTGHALFIFILSALWLSTMAFKIKSHVDRVIGDRYTSYDNSITSAQKLDGAYAILYFFGALEVMAWSILGFIDTKKRKASGQLQTILLGLVAGPLLLRSTYMMAYAIDQYLQNHYGNKHLNLAFDIIYSLASLAIYAGIVAICSKIARANPPPLNPNHINPPYGPNVWAPNGNQLPVRDPKNPMAVHEVAPPVYQQHSGYQTTPQQGGYYAPQPPAPQQFQQPQYQSYPNQQQQQQQHYQTPYQNPGSPPYQQPFRGAGSPPPMQQPYGSPSASPIHSQPQHTHTMTSSGPSEMNASSVSELSSPTNQHAR